MTKPWDGVITADDQERYDRAGFGRPSGIGSRPALLIIDVQYRTTGTTPLPFFEAIKEFPTSCGEVAWKAVGNIKLLADEFRKRGWPVQTIVRGNTVMANGKILGQPGYGNYIFRSLSEPK